MGRGNKTVSESLGYLAPASHKFLFSGSVRGKLGLGMGLITLCWSLSMVVRGDCNVQGSWTERWVVRGKQDPKDHSPGSKGGWRKEGLLP